MKRIVTIQDISCFGKCSQTVALPIISAMGIEAVLLPTAVLSTHTGEFKGYSFHSLTEEMPNIIHHWKKENIKFDSIYVGYIGSINQIAIINEFIDTFSDKDTLVYIDPAMADNGELYSGLDIKYVKALKELCKKADIISPNVYEAMLLSKLSCEKNYIYENSLHLLEGLTELCPNVIITGVHEKDKIITIAKKKSGKEIFKMEHNKINEMFYGTGDIFASVFISAYTNGSDFEEALTLATQFVYDCIENTLPEHEKYWYGVNFENQLYKLCEFSRKENE